MKRISLILLISFCTMVPELQAEMSKEELHKIEELQKQFELFTACKPIDLFVTDLPPDAKKINLTEKARPIQLRSATSWLRFEFRGSEVFLKRIVKTSMQR